MPSTARRRCLAPPTPVDALAADMAILTALAPTVAAHPDLPELLSRTFDADGMFARPYLHIRPLTALAAWLEVLPARMATRVRPAIGGGTEVVSTGRLAGHTLTLAVTTWRDLQASGDGLLSMTRLRRAAAEEAHSTTPAIAPTAQ